MKADGWGPRAPFRPCTPPSEPEARANAGVSAANRRDIIDVSAEISNTVTILPPNEVTLSPVCCVCLSVCKTGLLKATDENFVKLYETVGTNKGTNGLDFE